MRRYAEFYDSCMVAQTRQFAEQAGEGNTSFANLPAFNMLNIKYVVIGPQREHILPNNSAFGNGWFVRNIIPAGDAVEELEKTCSADTRSSAVIDTSKFNVGDIAFDSTATIHLVEATAKHL